MTGVALQAVSALYSNAFFGIYSSRGEIIGDVIGKPDLT